MSYEGYDDAQNNCAQNNRAPIISSSNPTSVIRVGSTVLEINGNQVIFLF